MNKLNSNLSIGNITKLTSLNNNISDNLDYIHDFLENDENIDKSDIMDVIDDIRMNNIILWDFIANLCLENDLRLSEF